ncbi:predicted protein [Sclerotinia sclerotiorum 1980 UF-70]|uniref:Uncharacterized protein n=1 Tax=Sclerotinia sclerotiorum (strain ATCC 18683 / 1980 / Ss-1) TaxID=665079 RepID=A7EDU3_SCLS1|nr:predicted protein [Sclerotinia sclerotiorum 1980 UF-70]EDO01009.1 predicted protein [Sclerotinia sclerotiorum 1980 UF-70]
MARTGLVEIKINNGEKRFWEGVVNYWELRRRGKEGRKGGASEKVSYKNAEAHCYHLLDQGYLQRDILNAIGGEHEEGETKLPLRIKSAYKRCIIRTTPYFIVVLISIVGKGSQS